MSTDADATRSWPRPATSWLGALGSASSWAVAVWTLTGAVGAWALARLAGVERGSPSVQLMAFTPYVAFGALVPLAAAVLTGRWAAAAVAGLAAAVLLGCVLPRAFGSPSTMDGESITVMSVNLRIGAADVQAIVDIVADREVDLLTLQELTPDAYDRLTAAGVEKRLPHHEVSLNDRGGGSAVYSRFDLIRTAVLTLPDAFTQVGATAEVPGVGAVMIQSVHPAPPLSGGTVGWAAGLRAQPPAGAALTVLAGDFNATLDHVELRRLLHTGYRDAAAAVGRGLTPTWPYAGPRAAVVPKVTIDHVLVNRDIGVRAFDTAAVAGTDHRAIIAVLVLPRL